MNISSKVLGSLLIHLSVFFWGSSFIFQKILLQHNIPPLYTLAFRFLPIICLIPLIPKNVLNRKTILYGFVLGCILFLSLITQTIGLKKIDASISAFLTSTSIVLIPCFNYLLYKKKFYLFNIASMGCAMIGIIMFNYQPSSGNFTLSPSIIITMIGSLGFTFHIIYEHFFLNENTNPIALHICQCITVSILSFINALFFEQIPTDWSPIAIWSMLYLCFFASIIGFGFQIYGQHLAKDPIKAGLIISLEPVWAFIFSLFILQEYFSTQKILGIFFIGLGIFICEFFNYKKQKQHSY